MTTTGRVRPAWARGVSLVGLPDDTLRVVHESRGGADVEGAGPVVRRWLEQFDGAREQSHQLDQAEALGIDRRAAAEVLARLWQAGLLIDAAMTVADRIPPGLMVYGRGLTMAAVLRLLPTGTANSTIPRPLTDESGAVGGWSAVAESVGPLIEGVRVAMLVLDGPRPDAVEVGFSERLGCAGVPQLVVGAGAVAARVGPLVIPGRTPCLRCEELAQREWDPRWQEVSREAALRPANRSPTDEVLAALVAAEAVRQLRRCRDLTVNADPPQDCAIAGGVLQIGEEGGVMERRPLSRHRACGCWWSDLVSVTA